MKHKRKISLSQYHEEGGSFLFIDSAIFDDFDTYVDSIRDWSKDSLENYHLQIIYGGKVEKIRIYLQRIIIDLEESEVETVGLRNVSVAEAARRLGKPEQFVRVALQKERAPFGFAVKVSKWTYHISPKKLDEYIGCEAKQA